MSQDVYKFYHKGCRHCSVGNFQSNCNKGTCLQSLSATGFSVILFCCELWQAVQVHKRYTDPLRLYRQGFDITEYTNFQNYTPRQGLKLQLDWELSHTLKVVEPESVYEMCTWIARRCSRSKMLPSYFMWGDFRVNRAICLGKDNINLVYIHSRLTMKGVWKAFKRR
jgi:hypothetical protein